MDTIVSNIEPIEKNVKRKITDKTFILREAEKVDISHPLRHHLKKNI